ncbi:MAG: hypothetical protein NVSMB48_04400 [Marmoricola sp.]
MTNTPQFEPLSSSELDWIAAHVEHARNLGVDPSQEAAISAFFDSSLSAVTTGEASQEIANTVVNVVAALLGERLCQSAGLEWAIVSDEFGTDLCVRRPGTSLAFFPQSSVSKRWTERESGWVEPFCTWVRERVAELSD